MHGVRLVADSQSLAFPVDPPGTLVGTDFRVAVFDLRTGKTRVHESVDSCSFAFDERGALRSAGSASGTRFLPGTPEVAYVFSPRNRTKVTSILRVDPVAGTTTELAPLLAKEMFDPRVDPRGRLCVFLQAGLRCIAPGAQRAEVVPTPVAMPQWPGVLGASPFSPDGERLVFVDHATKQVWLHDRATGESRMIHANRGQYRSVTFLDGERVLLSDPAYGPQPLLELELSSGVTRTLAEAAEWTEPSVVSSSGAIFIGREREAQRDLWVLFPHQAGLPGAAARPRRLAVLSPGDPLVQRQERPDLRNACTSDDDCHASGCSPACTAEREVADLCLDAPIPPIGECGCVTGTCRWFRPEQYAGPGSRGQRCFEELFCLPGLTCTGNAPGTCEPPPR